ncbi:piezo-type mechanosensitive ion channel component 1-like isoform X2 [Dysidea avara]|uniref:piezo-type mechanosensitive ion channel component 1-like isoform X2 n=1 Tax=Dysidea avara TaxID=196820 RepID=UPI003320CAFF
MALQLKYFSPLDVAVEEPIAHSSLTEEGDDNTPKLLQKLIKYIHIFAEFCWKFLEIYLDKVITIVAFVLVLQQVSSTHIITLLILLGPIVGMRATRVWYPILTLYISVLIMLKMMYQVRMVEVDTFDLTDECSAIDVIDSHKAQVTGEMFNYKYSPRESDPAWFGFFKVECQDCSGFISYITVHIVLVMLIACRYSVSRRQARCQRQHDNSTLDTDKLVLFPGITVEEMDTSILKTVAYLVSHIFEFYGLHLCWCVLAINIAVRIDVYGVVYAVALGLLLFISWMRLWPAWVIYLLFHGCLLVLQYLLLLNTPYGACIQDGREDKELPWSDMEPLALKRWLWLPLSSDNVTILNKDWLWADFFSFLFLCSESFNFPQRSQQPATNTIGQRFAFCAFDQAEILLDHIKRVVFKHSYWFTIFIIVAVGVAQVSILGVVYLLACFVLLWFGSRMQLLPPRKLSRRWFMLLAVVWCVLLVKISLQVRTCVYPKNEYDDDCVITRLFNAQCGARSYYGVTDPDKLCDDLPRHVGLWLDVFAFAAITIQTILFASPYWSYIRDYTIAQHLDDDTDRITDALLNKINTQVKKNRDKEKEMKENIRERLLAVKKKYKTSVVEHYLRAGVVLPRHIKFIGEDQALYHDRAALVQRDVEQFEEPVSPTIVIDDDQGTSEEEDDRALRPGRWRIIGVMLELLDNALAMAVGWLRGTSIYYFYILEQLEAQRSQESRDLQHVPELPSQGPQLVSASSEDPTPASSSEPVSGESPVDTALYDDSYLLYNKEKVYKIWDRIKHRPMELLVTSYYAVLANTQYICYLLIVLNVTVHGSVLSLVYAVLMFLWGLLSIPWPTKRFWLTLMFYNMFVILVKYGFQFQQVDWSGSPESGLYWPRVLGVEKKDDFLKNTIWDIMLLVSLFFHRHLLQETKCWDIPGYFVVTSYEDIDGTSALKLLFKKRSEISVSKTSRGSQGDDRSKTTQDQPDYYWSDQDDDDDDNDDDDDADENNLIILVIKNILVNIKYFYNQIISPDVSLGAHNYYMLSFIMDTISFIIIVVGFSSFGADEDEGVTAVASYIEENNIPIPFLMMLFAHFLSMVIDRAIYLRKFVTAKLMFYLFQLAVWHLWLFFILPSSPVTDKAFTDNGFSQALYFFKCQYFILSAQQCVGGFPKRVLGYFISEQYNIVASFLFRIYRAIPLLPELKEVMDWMFTPTSLELSHWLKVQEVWSLLYIIKNQRKWEKSDRRMLGDPESFTAKLLMGGGLLILLILLIWGPLLIIALLNTTTIGNSPVEVSIELSIGSFEPLLTMKVGEYGIRRLDDTEFDYVSSDYSRSKKSRKSFEDSYKQSDFRYILFSGNSTSVWEISPPARAALEDYLQQNESVYVPLVFSWEITREPETGLASEIVSGEVIRKLYRNNPEDMQTRQNFVKLLQNPASESVFLVDLFPQYIYAPANGPSTALGVLSRGRYVNCTASLRTRNVTVIPIGASSLVSITMEWWALKQNSSHHAVMGREDNVEFIIYSERINDPEFSFIAGLGIIGLYVSVVLVIGSAIRRYVTQLPRQIIYDEIPNPDSLLELCDDIFYVREDGQLQEEEILVSRLFFTFRSSVRLIEETRWKLD